MSGRTVYAYVEGNPISLIDPYGLFDFPSLPQGVVDAAAGFGDGVSFGATNILRDALGINGSVNHCSRSYGRSHFAGTALPFVGGVGRLAYAGATRAIPLLVDASGGEVAQALRASAVRNTLKQWFRGDISGTSSYRIYDAEQLLADKYGGDAAELLEASGRSSGYFNALGATAVAGSVANEHNAQCGCQ